MAERSICAEEADRVERVRAPPPLPPSSPLACCLAQHLLLSTSVAGEQAGASNEPGSVRVGEHDLPMTRAFGNLRLKVAAGRDWTQEAANAQVTPLPDLSTAHHTRSARPRRHDPSRS